MVVRENDVIYYVHVYYVLLIIVSPLMLYFLKVKYYSKFIGATNGIHFYYLPNKVEEFSSLKEYSDERSK